MNTNIFVTASALSDQDLLARLAGLASNEREASAELVAHLAALDARPTLYAAQGYGSLFGYCTKALRLSEDAACTRIEAARACRRFPRILDLLASGVLSLTSVRLLGPHLTAENHESILARARDRKRREIEALVAELAPQPDVPSTVRKLPCRTATPSPLGGPAPDLAPGPRPRLELGTGLGSALTIAPSATGTTLAPLGSPLPATARPIVHVSAPERYRVQFTIGRETHEKLRRLQALLRREIPDGDPGVIFDRALTMLLEKVETTKLAAIAKPRPNRPIRPGTDTDARRSGRPSRHVPGEVKRAVWERDGGQCGFMSTTGRRCAEGTFLEFHHVQPYARQGPATVANISLRCWRHNHYEGELIFGPHGPSTVREVRSSFGRARPGPGQTIDT